MIFLTYTVLLLGIGFVFFCFAAGFILFRFLCVRTAYEKYAQSRKKLYSAAKIETGITDKAETLTLFATCRRRFFLFPKRKIVLCADLYNHPDSTRAQKPHNIAVLVHALSDSDVQTKAFAKDYYKRGFSVLNVDLRAHGKSGGTYAGLGYVKTDAADLCLWLRCLVDRFGTDIRIVLHGISTGAAAVIQCAYGILAEGTDFNKEKNSVKLVVADSSFFRFSESVRHLLFLCMPKAFVQRLLFSCAAAAASCINFIINGFTFFANCPGTCLQRFSRTNDGMHKTGHCTLLLFHGKADTFVPLKAAHSLYAFAPEPKKLIVTENAAHAESYFFAKDQYMNEILGAFESAAV